MNIHEYQAKQLLRDFGVAVLRGGPASTVEEAIKVAEGLGGPVWVVKAQIHAGGRGKGGGVKVVKSLDEVRAEGKRMLGMTLVTPQTGPKGKTVHRLYIEDGCAIARELYLGMLLDRATSRVTLMASSEGGMEIEEVAAKHPEKIVRVAIDPALGLMPFHARKIAYGLDLQGNQVASAVKFLGAMYKAFIALDASIVEINPLVVTQAGEVVALDAKMNFDDNALFRHKDIEELRDRTEEDPPELEASKYEPQLHQARRQHRLHGQRRRPGHGDDGHHQARRRRAGELPRRRRRRNGSRSPTAFKLILSDHERARRSW